MTVVRTICCATVLLGLAGQVLARPPTGGDALSESPEFSGPVKKTPSFLHRPDRASPEAQLAHAVQLRQDQRPRKATRQYRALVHHWHESSEAVVAQQAFAELLLEAGKHERAFEEYQYMVDFYSGEFPLESVLEQQFKIANHIRTTRRGKVLVLPGVRAPERSLKLFEQIVENGPAWERSPEAQFHIGLIQEERKEYEEAISAYEMLLLRYPRSQYVAASHFRRAYCSYRVSKTSPRDEERCRIALSQLIIFSEGYPNDDRAEEATRLADALKARLAAMYFERADFYDRIAKRPRAAIIAYNDYNRKFPKSDRRQWVDGRIATLETQLAEQEGLK